MVLSQLAEQIASQEEAMEAWFEAEFAKGTPPFYSSVDLRHSGFKIAPVDTNLFPAGFNNLSSEGRDKATALMKRALTRRFPEAKTLLLIPENHTRNKGYMWNLHTLLGLLSDAGIEVKIGRMDEEMTEVMNLETEEGEIMPAYPLKRDGAKICTSDGYTPDVILVNNDMTSGAPELLCGIEQPVMPPPGMGWYRRRKSEHFNAYAKTSAHFADTFGMDAWLIAAAFHQCGRINFRERQGVECVALGVEKVLRQVREKYDAYGIKEDPYVFIKANTGTYGMGIMTAKSGDDVYEMNKKTRNKMNASKEGAITTEVIIQEGIPTVDVVNGVVSEPMMYLADGEAAGGMYRTNGTRDAFISLNTREMIFKPMASSTPEFAVYRLIARLATLATMHEEYAEPPCPEEAD